MSAASSLISQTFGASHTMRSSVSTNRIEKPIAAAGNIHLKSQQASEIYSSPLNVFVAIIGFFQTLLEK